MTAHPDPDLPQHPTAATESHDATTRATAHRAICRSTTKLLFRHIDRWNPTARAGAIIVLLFGGMAAVSQLAAAHATEAGWTVGAALALLIITMVISAVRSSSPLMPDLPHTDRHSSTSPPADDASRPPSAPAHTAVAGCRDRPTRPGRRPALDHTRRPTSSARLLETR